MEIEIDGPVRTCVGCRERAARRDLLRMTLGTDAHGQPVVVPDPSGTAAGRGAHLHPTPECLALAERRRAIPRALRYEGGKPLGLDGLHRLLENGTTLQSPQHHQTENWSNSS